MRNRENPTLLSVLANVQKILAEQNALGIVLGNAAEAMRFIRGNLLKVCVGDLVDGCVDIMVVSPCFESSKQMNNVRWILPQRPKLYEGKSYWVLPCNDGRAPCNPLEFEYDDRETLKTSVLPVKPVLNSIIPSTPLYLPSIDILIQMAWQNLEFLSKFHPLVSLEWRRYFNSDRGPDYPTFSRWVLEKEKLRNLASITQTTDESNEKTPLVTFRPLDHYEYYDAITDFAWRDIMKEKSNLYRFLRPELYSSKTFSVNAVHEFIEVYPEIWNAIKYEMKKQHQLELNDESIQKKDIFQRFVFTITIFDVDINNYREKRYIHVEYYYCMNCVDIDLPKKGSLITAIENYRFDTNSPLKRS
ncbi:MAG: hypothetical protein UR28_C0042G0001 [Candidatus Peregrinibacteria bacterium GW2011_GWF2_33_10]|nr:MAG: hypothetical protein UR28_C0042G0001 [Candidatus Peregrinibacteria bacterium GW2011_GWF2_33_10]OGJ45696.1 MAG: hypothetical protein A2263_01910 [Candidatus Peregrinibacteria bacterium RIFOXYA2_FULL_33_21]OGJ51272.1 MAG: hypothetical protein A2307_00345 [Candidatus Peregrinibacteria bacterium RIFOXYB2_FULL_33_20]